MKILAIDQTSEMILTRMILAGIGALNENSEIQIRSRPIELESTTMNRLSKGNYNFSNQFSAAFVSLSLENLANPTTFLKVISLIHENNPSLDVFVVPEPSATLTAPDILVLFLTGVAGVIEERLLVLEPNLSRAVSHKATSNRYRSTLLIGSSSHELAKLWHMLREWNNDDESTNQLDLCCWKASIALGQLEKIQLGMGGAHPYTYVKYAQALIMASTKTGIRFSEDELRRAMSVLARRYLGDHFEKFELTNFSKSQIEGRCVLEWQQWCHRVSRWSGSATC